MKVTIIYAGDIFNAIITYCLRTNCLTVRPRWPMKYGTRSGTNSDCVSVFGGNDFGINLNFIVRLIFISGFLFVSSVCDSKFVTLVKVVWKCKF